MGVRFGTKKAAMLAKGDLKFPEWQRLKGTFTGAA
jgi:hypothetical protein